MQNPRVKPEKIGVKVMTKSVGFITLRQDHGPLLAREGKFQYLVDGDKLSTASPLVPLAGLKVPELRELAKDLKGYKSKMNKADLIALIENAPS